jgi:hypothetical protein
VLIDVSSKDAEDVEAASLTTSYFQPPLKHQQPDSECEWAGCKFSTSYIGCLVMPAKTIARIFVCDDNLCVVSGEESHYEMPDLGLSEKTSEQEDINSKSSNSSFYL